MKKRKAQAQIITTVLIILLVLAAIVIVWNVVNFTISESSEDVDITIFTNPIGVEKVKLIDKVMADKVEIEVKKGTGRGKITELKFIFYNKDGESEIVSKKDDLPSSLETKPFYFEEDNELPYPVNEIEKISVVPVFKDKFGMEVEGPEPVDAIGEILEIPGLVSWWRFEEETEGVTPDSVGGNDGTFKDGITGNGDGDTPPIINEGVLVLNGIDDYVLVTRHPSINSEFSEQTIMAWAKPISIDPDKLNIFSSSSSSYYLHIENNKFGYNTNGCRFIDEDNPCDSDGWETVLSTTTPQEGEWYHVAGVFDGNEMSIYVNGVKENSIPVSRNIFDSTNWDLTIGAFPDIEVQPHYFHGSIDNVMIFNKALSEEEIKKIYENT